VGLVLRRRRDVLPGGEVDQQGLDFGATHVAPMALLVEQDKAALPVDGALLGAVGVVACTQALTGIVQSFRVWCGHRTTPGRMWQAIEPAFSMTANSSPCTP
jgi:hypothetical protein